MPTWRRPGPCVTARGRYRRPHRRLPSFTSTLAAALDEIAGARPNNRGRQRAAIAERDYPTLGSGRQRCSRSRRLGQHLEQQRSRSTTRKSPGRAGRRRPIARRFSTSRGPRWRRWSRRAQANRDFLLPRRRAQQQVATFAHAISISPPTMPITPNRRRERLAKIRDRPRFPVRQEPMLAQDKSYSAVTRRTSVSVSQLVDLTVATFWLFRPAPGQIRGREPRHFGTSGWCRLGYRSIPGRRHLRLHRHQYHTSDSRPRRLPKNRAAVTRGESSSAGR